MHVCGTISTQKVSPESLKFSPSPTPTPHAENPFDSDFTALLRSFLPQRVHRKQLIMRGQQYLRNKPVSGGKSTILKFALTSDDYMHGDFRCFDITVLTLVQIFQLPDRGSLLIQL